MAHYLQIFNSYVFKNASIFMEKITKKNLVSKVASGQPISFKLGILAPYNNCLKIALLGAMGGVGQATALMLKQCCWFDEVAVYDLNCTKGLAMELNHIDTNCIATSHDGPKGAKTAIKGADIVLITAGAHRKIGMSRRDLFVSNAKIVATLAKECAIHNPNEEIVKICRAVQNAGEEILKAKNNTGASTLGMAFAGTRFVVSLAKGLLGHDNIVECAYVMSNLMPELCYFSSQLQLGPTGIQKNLGVPDLSNFECCLLETAIPFLKKDIEFGEQFAAEMVKQGLLTRKKA